MTAPNPCATDTDWLQAKTANGTVIKLTKTLSSNQADYTITVNETNNGAAITAAYDPYTDTVIAKNQADNYYQWVNGGWQWIPAAQAAPWIACLVKTASFPSGVSMPLCSKTGCLVNSDCPCGQQCASGRNTCVPATAVLGCGSDTDCAAGQRCLNGVCSDAAPRGCGTNADCPTGQTCVNGTCSSSAPATCSRNSDCASGQTCSNGSCVTPAACSATNPCPTGKVCHNNTCVPKSKKWSVAAIVGIAVGGFLLLVLALLVIFRKRGPPKSATPANHNT